MTESFGADGPVPVEPPWESLHICIGQSHGSKIVEPGLQQTGDLQVLLDNPLSKCMDHIQVLDQLCHLQMARQ